MNILEQKLNQVKSDIKDIMVYADAKIINGNKVMAAINLKDESKNIAVTDKSFDFNLLKSFAEKNNIKFIKALSKKEILQKVEEEKKAWNNWHKTKEERDNSGLSDYTNYEYNPEDPETEKHYYAPDQTPD